MKAYEIMMYFLIVNGLLTMFTTVSVFSTASKLGIAGWEVTSVQSLLGFTGWTGVGAMGVATLVMLIMAKAGVNPFSAFAFGSVVGVFSIMYVRVFGVMAEITSSMEGYASIMASYVVLIGTVFAITFLWGLIQMAQGGGRGQDA